MIKKQKTLKIGNNNIGHGFPVYFIADIAANHDGDLDRAKKLIELAKNSGADAAKFQHHDVSKYVSDKGFKSLGGKFSHQSKWEKSIFEVYKDAEVPLKWTEQLKLFCDEIEIDFFSTPYDLDMIDHLDDYVAAYKIGSGDVAWNRMLEKVASKGKPILFATGAATLEEVLHAHNTLSQYSKDIIVMQCNTNYTGSTDNFKYINLNVLKTYSILFPDTILGLSDHTPGHETVLGSVALGALVIEKHFTDDTSRSGPDHPFSMDPNTWKTMVESTRLMEVSLGSTIKKVEENEKETLVLQRRSIRAVADIKPGEELTLDKIQFKRPCPSDAIKPNEINNYLGRKVKIGILTGDYLKHKDIL